VTFVQGKKSLNEQKTTVRIAAHRGWMQRIDDKLQELERLFNTEKQLTVRKGDNMLTICWRREHNPVLPLLQVRVSTRDYSAHDATSDDGYSPTTLYTEMKCLLRRSKFDITGNYNWQRFNQAEAARYLVQTILDFDAECSE